MYLLGKQAYPQGYRGFESLPLRHLPQAVQSLPLRHFGWSALSLTRWFGHYQRDGVLDINERCSFF
jgi:hypothetical protein